MENLLERAKSVTTLDEARSVMYEVKQVLDALGRQMYNWSPREREQVALQGDNIDYPVMFYTEADFSGYYGEEQYQEHYGWIETGWQSSSQWKGC